MTNNDTLNETPKGRYKLFRRDNGTTGLIHDPLGNCIVVTDAVEVAELDLTPEEVASVRRSFREDKLDFAAAKKAYGKGRKPKAQPGV